MGKIMKCILFGFFLLIIGLVWVVIDWHSPRHWIGIKTITDSTVQTEGDCGFLLPAGNYVIVVSGGPQSIDRNATEKNDLYYLLEIPSEGIRIEKQKVVEMWFVGDYLQEEVVIKNHRTKGHLKVKVMTPSKSKVSVGLYSNKFAGV